MDIYKSAAALAVAGFLCTAGLSAAPRLRLVASTIGPVSIAPGSNGSAQTVEAYNAADGSLNLSFSSSVSWIAVTKGAQQACSTTAAAAVCTPLQFALNTSALPAGTATGVVTVSDANPLTVDAPQTIAVTVQIGGAVPSSLTVYAAPGAARDLGFSTNSQLGAVVKTNDGGGWLSIALDGSGSFRFSFPYRIHFAPSAAMGQGTYPGLITTSGSSFAADNKSIPVTMQVTTQPIAQPSTGHLSVRLAQGAPVYSTAIALTNLGQGSLHIQDAKTSGAAWITALKYSVGGLIPDGAAVTIDPKGLAPNPRPMGRGRCRRRDAGAQGDTTSLSVPVDLEIVAAGPPVVDFQGVLDNAIFNPGDTIARGDIVAVKGQQLSKVAPASGKAPPLSTQVEDTQVLLNGVPIPLYYTSYGQINCQIPTDAPTGTATARAALRTRRRSG